MAWKNSKIQILADQRLEAVRALAAEGKTPREIAALIGVSRCYVVRLRRVHKIDMLPDVSAGWKVWTPAEENILSTAIKRGASLGEIAPLLPARSHWAIVEHAKRLGLHVDRNSKPKLDSIAKLMGRKRYKDHPAAKPTVNPKYYPHNVTHPGWRDSAISHF